MNSSSFSLGKLRDVNSAEYFSKSFMWIFVSKSVTLQIQEIVFQINMPE